MKKSLLTLAVSMCALSMTAAETPQTFTIDGKDYSYNLITSKQVGPVWSTTVSALPIPLNINYMTVDLTNPYNRIETQQANERVRQRNSSMPTRVCRKPERSQSALKRQLLVCVGSRINSQFALGTLINGCMRNGQIVNETNCHNDIGRKILAYGVVGMGYDKDLHIESMSWKGYISSPRFAPTRSRSSISSTNSAVQMERWCFTTRSTALQKFQTIEYVNDAWTTVDNKTCEVYLKLKTVRNGRRTATSWRQ
ncbi:MAG: hypothetical protein L6U61_01400 [Bacteroidales bacterium]|nr:MAG: hypothetical protein L6U61_01400 [Bacteroidales bacterium]